MSIKILGTIDKVTAKDGRVIQQAGDTDGVVASFYDLSGRPSLFLDGTQARLGNVGVKTATPNEALTVVGNVSSDGYYYGLGVRGAAGGDLELKAGEFPWTLRWASGNLEVATSKGLIGGSYGGNQVMFPNGGGLQLNSLRDGTTYIQTGSAGDVNMTWAFSNDGSLTLPAGATLQSAGPVNIKVNTTIAGTLSSSGLISQQKNHCVAALSANQAMTQSDTKIEFHDKDDPNNWWNSANHTFQPTVAGYYNVMIMVNWQGINSEVQVNNQLRKNGNTIALSQMPIPKTLTHSIFMQAITFMNGSSDYLDVSGYAGVNTSITGEANGNWTKFEAFKIS